MKLYLISQTANEGYDTYDSAIVCASSEDEARKIHPSRKGFYFKDGEWFYPDSEIKYKNNTWCKVEEVSAKYLGEADKSIPEGIVLSSFNAG